MSARGELSGLDHAMQANHERLPFDIEFCLLKTIHDVLNRQAKRTIRQTFEHELLDLISPSPRSHEDRLAPARGADDRAR